MKKSITCPKCGRHVFNYDTNRKMPVEARCSKCNVLVLYNGQTEKKSVGKIPDKKSASGVRFY